MKYLPDHVPIQRLCIPGTHDSCTRHGIGSIFQDWSLPEQLEGGVRFFDIRGRHCNNRLSIHQGINSDEADFESVRDIFVQFLKENPSEFLLLSLKPFGCEENNDRNYEHTFRRYISGYEQYFFLKTGLPTIGDVRGKAVLIRGFGGSLGIPWTGEYFAVKKIGSALNDDHTTNGPFTPSWYRRYSARPTGVRELSRFKKLENEWHLIEDLFEQARRDPDNQKFYVSYLCSCYKASEDIYAFSLSINPRVRSYFKQMGNDWSCVVPLDFPDRATINVIINTSLLRFDALQGRTCRLLNTQHREYLFVPHYAALDGERHRAVTASKRSAMYQSDWLLQDAAPNEFFLFNTAQKEYLYASDEDAFDEDRRRVLTWQAGHPVSQGRWRLELRDPDHHDEVRIYNVHHGEYLFADVYLLDTPEGERREVFTWIPGNPMAPGVWKLEFQDKH